LIFQSRFFYSKKRESPHRAKSYLQSEISLVVTRAGHKPKENYFKNHRGIFMKTMNTRVADLETIKMVVAGEAGNGKTTLAKTLQNGLNEKVLVISAEAGLLSLRGSDIDYVELQREWSDEKKEWIAVAPSARIGRLGQIFAWVKEPEQMKKYKWLFIDSLTEIQQNALEWLESLEEYSGPKNTIKKYGELSTQMMSLCKGFRDLAHYNVVFSALVKNDTDSDGLAKMKVSMVGAFADRLPALFDEILYLGVTAEKDEATGASVRKLLTQKTNKIDFPKDRSGKLSDVEPADLSVIVKKIRASAVIADISSKGKAAAAEVKTQKAVAGVTA
jgi:hypothetical protein